mgnify:CR=1 FL=1
MQDNFELNNKKDLADGTFVKKIPAWLRWLLFLPSAIIVPLMFLILQSLFSNWFLDVGKNAFYFNFLRGVVYGTGFIYIGALVAPRKQKLIALILLVFTSMVCGVALLSLFYRFVFNEFLEDILTLIAAIYAFYHINQEEELI